MGPEQAIAVRLGVTAHHQSSVGPSRSRAGGQRPANSLDALRKGLVAQRILLATAVCITIPGTSILASGIKTQIRRPAISLATMAMANASKTD
jgi:hypothetical protein